VTAQRVAEPISKTPVTMSALGGEELAKRHYTSVEDFKGSVPGLQVNNYVGNARANIRGIGQNTLSQGIDSQIAFSIDGDRQVEPQAYLRKTRGRWLLASVAPKRPVIGAE
jgi:iron complex outermembrane receptor protein